MVAHHDSSSASCSEASRGSAPPPRDVVEHLFEIWNEVTEAIEAEAELQARQGRGDEAVKEARLDRQHTAGLLIDQGQLEQGRVLLSEMLVEIRRAQQPQVAAVPSQLGPRPPAVPPASASCTDTGSSASGVVEF